MDMYTKFAVNKDLYALLGVKMSAGLNEIRAAYRHAALVAHPDKGGTSEAFHEINLAFQVLSSSTTRQLYNRSYLNQQSLRRRRLAGFGRQLQKAPSKSNLKRRAYGIESF